MIPRPTRLFLAAAILSAASACTTGAPTKPSSTTPEATPAPQQVTLVISSQPQSQTIESGSHATLSVAGTGNGTLRYQWYVGASGATSTPLDGQTAATFTTPALSATTSYWVRVADTTGSIDSATATITVTPPASTPGPTPTPAPTPTPSPTPAPTPAPTPTVTAPAITSQPESQTIQSGHTAQLSVQASGTTPFSYQWYGGTTGMTSSPISGAVSGSFTTPALTATTSYWVRVSNAAGSADSATATITVTSPSPPPGVAPTITAQPASQTITSGQAATLAVAASGTAPLSYQWYSGTTGVTSSPVSGAIAASLMTPALSVTTSYWVRVSNAFGVADSVTATIAVTPDPGNAAFEDQVLTLVNQQRAAGASCGGTPYPAVGPLTMDASLRLAARNHSQDMATNNYFSHTSLDGRTFDQRIHDAGYTGGFPLGENIAAGQPTPQSVVDAWMASPGHCTNIMNGSFHAVGVGYGFAAASTYRSYWTMDFGGG